MVYLPFVPNPPSFTGVSASLLREIYYNPHHRVPFDPVWRTTDVLALAQQRYDASEFSAMPILANKSRDAQFTDNRRPQTLPQLTRWVLNRR